MKKIIIELLLKELDIARLKEQLAELEYIKYRTGENHIRVMLDYERAQGYTNGILHAIETVRGEI